MLQDIEPRILKECGVLFWDNEKITCGKGRGQRAKGKDPFAAMP
jgi:hypothetical protein